MNHYSDKILHYEECSQLLHDLDTNNEVDAGLIPHFTNGKMYSDHAIEELINIGAAKRGENGSLFKTDATHSFNVRNYFQDRIREINVLKRTEDLHERSTKSSEKSAQAAIESANIAKRTLTYTIINVLCTVVSIIVSIIKCTE